MAGAVAPAIPVNPPPTLVRVNPAAPASTNPATGSIHLPVNQTIGVAVAHEAQAAGNLYLVPANKTYTGFATLFVGGSSGTVIIEDANSVVIHEVAMGAAGGPAVGPVQVPMSVAGGGGGNQLSVAVSGSAVVLSASVAGYVK